MSKESPYLTAEEAAEYLRRPSAKAIYQLVRRGRLPPPKKLGRRMLFKRSDLDAALEDSA